MPSIPRRELGTILAALRYWQATRCGEVTTPYREEIRGIASDNGEIPPLSEAEIDDLCEALNFDSDKPRLIVVVEGGVVQSVMSSTAVRLDVLDHDKFDGCTFGKCADRTHDPKCSAHTAGDFQAYLALMAEATALEVDAMMVPAAT